jgi:hypothetical protein
MQAEVELASFASVDGSLERGRPVDHQTRACHDALLVGLDHAAVDASAEAEVVGIDYQVTLPLHDCRPDAPVAPSSHYE